MTKQPSSKQFKIFRYSNLDYQARGGKTVYVLPKLVIFFQTDLALNNIGQMITKDHTFIQIFLELKSERIYYSMSRAFETRNPLYNCLLGYPDAIPFVSYVSISN